MKKFKGIIIPLCLIMLCLLALSVFLTIQLLQRTRDQRNTSQTSMTTTAGTSETTFGTSGNQTGTTTAGTTVETTQAVTTGPTTVPSTSDPAATTTRSEAPGLLTAEQARIIALDQFDSDVRVLEQENHTEDNPPHYEFELTDGHYDYDLKIHAVTGAVIDYEKEPVESGESENSD